MVLEEHRNPRRSRRLAYQRARLQQGLLMSVILLGTILCLTLGSLLTPDRTYSDSENRKLAQFPKLSWSAVKDGSWFSDLESYTADQFAGRDFWIALRLRFLKLTGQKESNGVYLCSGDYLMEPPADPPQDSRNVEAINAFAARHTDLRLNMAVIPNAACILADKLPKNAPVRDQSADLTALAGSLQGISYLDVSAALSAHTDEQLYYRTDHHWTSLGARYAFEAMAAQLGIPQPVQNYDTYTVSTTFEGTLASRSGSHAAYDTVELYVPQTDVEYYVSYGDAAETSATIYDRSALEQKRRQGKQKANAHQKGDGSLHCGGNAAEFPLTAARRGLLRQIGGQIDHGIHEHALLSCYFLPGSSVSAARTLSMLLSYRTRCPINRTLEDFYAGI